MLYILLFAVCAGYVLLFYVFIIAHIKIAFFFISCQSIRRIFLSDTLFHNLPEKQTFTVIIIIIITITIWDRFFSGVFRVFRINIIPPMVHSHLHLHVPLTGRTNGRSLGNFPKSNALPEIGENFIENVGVTSGFRRDVDDICALLGYYAA
jgi:hypothetical protein